MFLFALAVAAVPFGGVFAHVKEGNSNGHFIKGTVTVEGDTIKASGTVASTNTKVRRVEDGKWRFSLVNQNDKTVDAKVIPASGKGKSAEVTFKDVAKGVYRVVIAYNGGVLDKGRTKAQPHELRFVKSNLMVTGETQEEPQDPGNDNDGKDNDNSNDDKNGTQQPDGNDGKGTNGGNSQSGNNGKSSGTISNSGSGSQQATGGKLPKTATSLPMNAMIGGLLTLAGGAILFARRLVG